MMCNVPFSAWVVPNLGLKSHSAFAWSAETLQRTQAQPTLDDVFQEKAAKTPTGKVVAKENPREVTGLNHKDLGQGIKIQVIHKS